MLAAAGAPHEPAPLVAFVGIGGGACREMQTWAGRDVMRVAQKNIDAQVPALFHRCIF